MILLLQMNINYKIQNIEIQFKARYFIPAWETRKYQVENDGAGDQEKDHAWDL